jgi:hypothetical protein
LEYAGNNTFYYLERNTLEVWAADGHAKLMTRTKSTIDFGGSGSERGATASKMAFGAQRARAAI